MCANNSLCQEGLGFSGLNLQYCFRGQNYSSHNPLRMRRNDEGREEQKGVQAHVRRKVSIESDKSEKFAYVYE